MKIVLTLAFAWFLTSGCGKADTSDATATRNVPTIIGSGSTGSSKYPAKQEACGVLDLAEIAKLIHTNSDKLVKQDMSHIERDDRSICYYVNSAGLGHYSLKLQWKNEKAIENKALERLMDSYLANGDQRASNYQVVQDGDEEIVYGTSSDERTGHQYTMVKRWGNAVEAQLETSTETPVEDMRDAMLAVINSIK